MPIKISFIIKDPKSSELQPVYVKVKKDGIIEERETSEMVQVVNGRMVGNEMLQLKLKEIRRQLCQ